MLSIQPLIVTDKRFTFFSLSDSETSVTWFLHLWNTYSNTYIKLSSNVMQYETKTQHFYTRIATELEQHISACLTYSYKSSYFLQSFVQLLSVPWILSYILWYNMYSIWVSPPWHWFGPLFSNNPALILFSVLHSSECVTPFNISTLVLTVFLSLCR